MVKRKKAGKREHKAVARHSKHLDGIKKSLKSMKLIYASIAVVIVIVAVLLLLKFTQKAETKIVIKPMGNDTVLEQIANIADLNIPYVIARNQTITRARKNIQIDETTKIFKEAGTLVIDKVFIDKPGFVVIYQKVGKQIKDVLGYSKVFNGTAENIPIDIFNYESYGLSMNGTVIVQPVVALLHYDVDNDGRLDLPGKDSPVNMNKNESSNTLKLVYKTFSIRILPEIN